MELKLQVENIKCGGCGNTMNKIIKSIDSDLNIDINIENQEIVIEGPNEIDKDTIVSKLAKAGYPLAGTGTGFQKAKSYVSCMIGRVS